MDQECNILRQQTTPPTTEHSHAHSIPGIMKALFAIFVVALLVATPLGSASVAAQDFNDAVQGYVWANEPSLGNYTPDPAYSYNSSGGAVEIDSPFMGTYSVTFFGLGPVAESGDVQVTAFSDDGPAHCNIIGWVSAGPDLLIDLLCYDPAGALVDTRYDVLFISTAGGEVKAINADNLVALKVGSTYAKIGTTSFPMKTRLVTEKPDWEIKEEAIRRSRANYGTPSEALRAPQMPPESSETSATPFDLTDPDEAF